MTEILSPADELRAAAVKIREADQPAVTFGGFDITTDVAGWLDNTADWMADEHARIEQHPEWIGLAEDMRWGVFDWKSDRDDNAVWKSALVAARVINGGAA